MSLDAHRESVESTLMARMAVTYPAVRIKFNNAPFVQPETAWIAVHIIDGSGMVTNLGRGRQIDRHVGQVQVDVLVSQNSGTKEGNLIAGFIGDIWRLQHVSLSDGAVVKYRVPNIMDSEDQGGFHRMILRVPYWRDEPAR